MKTLHELFEDGIKDIYNAEKQLVKALPKMAKMAQNPRLKEGFQNHLRQTEEHARRVEQACQTLGMKPTGMVCHGMMGLIEEATEHMGELKPSACADAELIALAQKVEHYEIGTYGTLCTWAEMMGHNDALELFKQNLEEEKETDELLTEVADSEVNQMAAQESEQMGMGDKKMSSGTGGSRGARRESSNGKMSGTSSTGRSSGTRKSTSGRTSGRTSTSRAASGSRSGGSKRAGSKQGATLGRSSTSKSKSGGRSMR